ncbi:MAG: type IV secretory system conjugative DNA transfer family protein [Rickettsiales bacterium]|nr:type IV secretory system conjugative DNA transfer family protein [Rickettsiales bacterium]
MKIKNITSRLLIILTGFASAIILSSILFIYLTYGPQYIQLTNFGSEYLARNYEMFVFLWQQIIYYINWMIQNKTLVSFSANSYLAAKVFGVPSLVFSIFGIILIAKYENLMEWTPFKKKEKIYGDAKWASQEDVKRAKLRAKTGLLLGKDNKGNYVSSGYQHALLFAPTGSGKGVGFVIPNLLFWEDSCLVHDIKLENFELTSGWRTKGLGQQCFLWNPTDPDGKTHCYNPMDWISTKPGQMVDDVQKMANLLLQKATDFWESEARSLFVGIALYLCAVPEKIKSFGEVVRTIRSDDVAYNLAVVLDTVGKQIHPVAYMNLAAFLQKADKERSGVISTLSSALELWANPLVDAATAKSDFNMQELKKKRMTIYVGLTPDNITRLKKLMQVFYQQATDFLTRKIPDDKEEPYGVLFIMDEFPTLGKMEAFKSGIAYFRGYKVRLFLIVQDTQQLKGIYEESGMNSFLSNSYYRITFAANNMDTANLISKLCGNKTVESISETRPKFLDFSPGGKSQNVSKTSRALLLPQEVLTLSRDEQIVLIESFPPIKSKKIKYYQDSFFTEKLLPHIEVPRQKPYNPDDLAEPADENSEGTEETEEELETEE